MSAHATITLAHYGLEPRCPAANIGNSDDRQLTNADYQLFDKWSHLHRRLAQDRNAGRLLQLGEEMYAWLDGPARLLTRIVDALPAPPLIVAFIGRNSDEAKNRSFLDAPWELLTTNGVHLALHQGMVFCPVRRLQAAQNPPAHSRYRLNVVFMAAAPRGAANLNWEAEETSIIYATRNLGVDLFVEESGELDLLAACVAREKPDVVQISCHGTLAPKPALLLEDETGGRVEVPAVTLAQKLSGHRPRLLFLSACQTAESDPLLDSLARSLVQTGAPAVLGWAASVLDREATLFASHLHASLTRGDDLTHALAYARLGLWQDLSGPGQPGARDWHLARLYLNPVGGGSLATAGGRRRLTERGRALKAFLDTANRQVPVASEFEFVGRRREIQAVLRDFRPGNTGRHAGVLIHGMGRQGKSSLAARIAHRLENSHDTVVLYCVGHLPTASAIWNAFRRLGYAAEMVERHRDQIASDPRHLFAALKELLEGPCAQVGPREKSADPRPVLLVIDDLEQALDPSSTGLHTVKPDLIESLRAVIQAFAAAETDSRLLFTSRFQFTLPADGLDLATQLLDVLLHGMDEREAWKQATAKFRLETATPQHGKNMAAVEQELPRITKAARGNPGLQTLLTTICAEDHAGFEECIVRIEQGEINQSHPSLEKLHEFFENLAVDSLISLLSPGQRKLLLAAAYLLVPIPADILVLGVASSSEDSARLMALGLVESYDDPRGSARKAVAINALVRPYVGEIDDSEQEKLAGAISIPLFERWGAEEGRLERSPAEDHQLLALSLQASEPRVTAAVGADVLASLKENFRYREAAELAKLILGLLDSGGASISVRLLRIAAEALIQVGEVKAGNILLERALNAIDEGRKTGSFLENVAEAAVFLAYARTLVDQGEPNRALHMFEQARELFSSSRDRAVVTGDIARLRSGRGEVEAALALHQEALAVYEALGDKRSRAVTLGDIARLRSGRGEVEAALALHQEELAVYEALGDKRSRAGTLGDIARLRSGRGEVEAALALHQEALAVYEALGDKRSRAVTLGDIARLRSDRGEVEAALALHQEALAVYEALGDKRSRAVTLGDIARLRSGRGEVEAALALHQEKLSIVEALGDKRSRAVTLGDIAQLRSDRGEVEAALALHQEALAVYEALGDKRSRAVTLGDIAQLRSDRGEVAEALALHQEALAVYEALGDKRSRALTLGDIARLRSDRGDVEAALALHQEALAVYEALGDKRSRAVTLGDIAQLRSARGEVEAALALHQEALAVYEALGDMRSRALTLGDIARLRSGRGEVEAALALHQEALAVHEALGDKRSRASALNDIAGIYLQQEQYEEGFKLLVDAYQTILQEGSLDGISVIGLDLGRLLSDAGLREKAEPILLRSRDGFAQLGWTDYLEATEAALQKCVAASA